jgi:Uma2 family endonuclease
MTQDLLTEPSSTVATPAMLTYGEFLTWEGPTPHVEWVDGKVVSMPPVSREHQDVGLFLLRLISDFVEARRLGRVFYEPFQMKTGPNLPGRAPDILFVATANLGRVQRLHLEGPGDLVVEIISPESRARDRGEKFYEYEQGGVPEFWLIDPPRRQAESYWRGEDGIHRLAPVGVEGIYQSKMLPGFALKVEWLWETPPPSVLSVLEEWKLI